MRRFQIQMESSSLGPRPSLPASSMSAPPGVLPLISLSDSYISPAPSTFLDSTTSLQELAHLVKLQNYQKHKQAQCRLRLHRSLVSTALASRFICMAELGHSLLVEHLKSDQKKDFAILYNAILDIRGSCEAFRRFALMEEDYDSKQKSKKEDSDEKPQELVSFLHETPPNARDTVLAFLSTVRSSPNFLAERISKLTQQDLEALARLHNSVDIQESVLGNGSRRAPSSSAASTRAVSGTPVERLLGFRRNDPLHILIHGLFSGVAGSDSVDEKLRTEVWSNVCAKLLADPGSKKSDQFLFSVLDTWAAMGDWPIKANLETCLMGLLQEGNFLLHTEETAKPQTEANPKMSFAAEEFYTKGVKSLFACLDDEPSAGGIPEGVLQFGHAILQKVEDPKKKKSVESFLLCKWFISHYLRDAIQYPERCGIMIGHQISEHARLKILRPLVSGMMKAAYNLMWVESLNKPANVEPVLRKHIESMMERFRNLRPKNSSPILHSARTGAPTKESQDVQQFIALCPSDIVTMYNTLYPKIFPSGSESRDIKRPLAASSRSFMGGKSPASSAFDMNSVLSRSSSSVVSESGASIYMPLLDRNSIPEDRISIHTSLSPAPSAFSGSTTIISSESEEEERFASELKVAMDTMAGRLSQDELSGRIHPCAENWALLFISRDGKELSLKMRSELSHDEDDEDDDAGHDSDSDDDGPSDMSALDREYHQLKQAILKLVEEYEILDMREEEERRIKEERNALYRNQSAPVVTLSGTTPPDTSKNDMSHLDPSNPYRATSNLTAMFADSKRRETEAPRKESDNEDVQHSALPKMLQAAAQQCLARGDFVAAQQYHRALQQLRRLSPSLARNGYSPLLHYFSMGARDSIDRSARAVKQTEAWFVWVSLTQESQEGEINEMVRTMKKLRDKMWYVTDVRNSAAFEEAKSVAFALKKMASSPAKTPPRVSKNTRSLSHRASNLSLLKSEGVLDVMSAPIEHGGPNKLSDEQSEITSTYLAKFCIENFCKGEERIHRFCHEIDRCVNKIVGDGMLDGPVLWSSELYARDDRELSSSRGRADWLMCSLGMSDDGYETDSSQSGWRAGPQNLLRKSSADFLGRSRVPPGVSAQEYNARRNRSKSNVGDSMMDRQDLFGLPSPAISTSDAQTFWSPFGGRAAAATSKSSGIMKQPEAVTREKRKFLDELKQTLTGLLLSDLGVDLWSKGTETDLWFSGPYVDDCIQRKEEQEEEARRRQKSRAQKKSASKKSGTKNLRKSVNQKGELTAPVENNVVPELSAGEGNSSASDATNVSTTSSKTEVPSTKPSDLVPFPYMVAFKRLLHKFSTHPNPFVKLQILYDLEILIISSLSSSSPSPDFERRISLPTSPLFQQMTEASRVSNLHLREPTNLEETIQNVEERRSCANGKNNLKESSSSPRGTPTRPRSPDQNIPNTDKIVEVLQDLFRQAEVRPKTLFRDLQYVAAFVPASILDMTELGKAFWDTALAALGLKQDVKNIMVEMADEIVGYQARQRNPDRSANQDRNGPGSEFFERYTLKDAAQMLMITAKEGDAAAQRELAIFYLTNPGDLPRIVKPLSKPKDTFRPQLMTQKGEDPEKRDPATMCTAYHWMELSAEGGDSLAKQYIRQRDRDESW
ncbi:hypothetical protein BJ508DRAFT_203160 [Ascobolus immersus RN42]|uniref:Uncharacterized protein n=1 Tax=Ascobolus immersus RN42 TaxID=1160509 RepID=A0A3N4IT26_ASCIM|nr:hypothetical protein BJ508DRAFT_203160 [Ascobolus immersus RN42]